LHNAAYERRDENVSPNDVRHIGERWSAIPSIWQHRDANEGKKTGLQHTRASERERRKQWRPKWEMITRIEVVISDMSMIRSQTRNRYSMRGTKNIFIADLQEAILILLIDRTIT
jgi:hypothetical protein